MSKLSYTGCIFYGIAIAVIGFLTINYRDFPYMMIPPHNGMRNLTMLAYISGVVFISVGICIVFKINAGLFSLLLATVLLLVFCFYFIPYELIISPNHLHFDDWENAAKELALGSGALVIAGCFSKKNESRLSAFSDRLISSGAILFSVTIISFSIDHFVYAHDAADYVPSWIPYHLFWLYFTGTALFGAGIAIILKIKRRLFAILLGTMIFIWFIILHLPRIFVSAPADMDQEIASAMLALAYSGIAIVIAGNPARGNDR